MALPWWETHARPSSSFTYNERQAREGICLSIRMRRSPSSSGWPHSFRCSGSMRGGAPALRLVIEKYKVLNSEVIIGSEA